MKPCHAWILIFRDTTGRIVLWVGKVRNVDLLGFILTRIYLSVLVFKIKNILVSKSCGWNLNSVTGFFSSVAHNIQSRLKDKSSFFRGSAPLQNQKSLFLSHLHKVAANFDCILVFYAYFLHLLNQQMMNEEKMEDVRMLEAQIQHLQTAVSALQDQLQDQQKNMAFNLGDQMQTAMSVLLIHSVF